MAETFDATDDKRITNNVMRHEYRKLQQQEMVQMKTIKDMGLDFFNMIDGLGASREISLAKTRVEEAVMWATKHITR
jgi:hypothetical protein